MTHKINEYYVLRVVLVNFIHIKAKNNIIW